MSHPDRPSNNSTDVDAPATAARPPSGPVAAPAPGQPSASPAPGKPSAAPPPPKLGGRLHDTLERIRANRTGHLALKITMGTLGALVVVVGIALIPLPGPGWALVIVGLAILAVEFVWARRLLHFTKRHVQSWTHWVARQSLPLRFVIGAVGIVFVSAVVWISVKVSFGIDLMDMARDVVTGG